MARYPLDVVLLTVFVGLLCRAVGVDEIDAISSSGPCRRATRRNIRASA